MPGINDSTLVYGVLDLIKRELQNSSIHNGNSTNTGVDPLGGTPSVMLEREHPNDSDVLTGAKLFYPSGWVSSIKLVLGMTDEEMEVALQKNQYGIDEVPDSSEDILSEWETLSAEEQSPSYTSSDEIGSDFDDSEIYIPNLLPVLPEDIKNSSHSDYDFYKNWRLNKLIIEVTNELGAIQDSFAIRLVYDYRSFLTSTLVERI